MDKLKIKLTHEGEDRFVELDRRAPSFAQVQGQINRKFGITGQTTLTFTLASGTSIPVNNDNDLRRAITEAAMSGEYYVTLTVRGGYRAAGQAQAARPQAAQPVSQPRPVHTQPQQPQQASAALRQPTPSPAQASNGVILTFTLPGVGGDGPVKFAPQEVGNAYLFQPTTAGTDTVVEVQQPDNKTLVFKSIPAHGNPIAQKFNLPFEFSASDLSLVGSAVKLTFPW